MAFDDLRRFFEKENWRYSFLLIWLLIGLFFLAFSSITSLVITGIFILLPLLAFLMFLFLLSIFSKKNIEEYSDRKIIGFMLLSVPIMLILSIILFVIFVFAIILYFFFTSWFIIYGSYLTGKSIDNTLKNHSYSKFTRGLEFFGGISLSLLLIVGTLIGIYLFGYYSDISGSLRNLLISLFIVVGSCIVFLTLVGFYYYRKGKNNSWLGIFFVLIVFYTYYLVAKLLLGLTGPGGESSLLAKIGLILVDFFIIMYSISTIWGSQADLLNQKIKHFDLDTVLIGLFFSKVSYEFAVNFPYNALRGLPIFANFPYIDQIINIGSNLSLGRNIAVLIFFFLLLLIIGVYQIRKPSEAEKQSALEIVKPPASVEDEGLLEEEEPYERDDETPEQTNASAYEEGTSEEEKRLSSAEDTENRMEIEGHDIIEGEEENGNTFSETSEDRDFKE
ncbi:MAG: conserved membrane protein of unknown function [Promethearchaeota archaeon]|nr:MAG: conserved membrane protein of unknown function [Candidatus Lokiarchaeota archaeon]